MSFVGSIGVLMDGSDLEKALQTVYGENTLKQIIKRKDIAMQLFIRAKRTFDWSMHLHGVSNMLNLFAATGHVNYTKSSQLYLQNMLELPKSHPCLYKKFAEDGMHVNRRSDRFCAGIWTDLAIEQVVVRALKYQGRLTRGRGITESVIT
ncbi:hypothetical protein Ahia01_000286900 [Argonauta hians]